MEHSTSWEAECRSLKQEINRLLWISNVQYCLYKNIPLVPYDNTSPSFKARLSYSIIMTFLPEI
jgi:hypothetical protein